MHTHERKRSPHGIDDEQGSTIRLAQSWLKQHGVRSRLRAASFGGTGYLQIDKRDNERVRDLQARLEGVYGVVLRQRVNDGSKYDERGRLFAPPIKVWLKDKVPLDKPPRYDHYRSQARHNSRRRQVAVTESTRPAWAALRTTLRQLGLKWGYNDAMDTHRRVKVTPDVYAWAKRDGNLTLRAIEAKHEVEIVPTAPGIGRETRYYCLRLYPTRR